jgi:hypothetical protein
VFRVHSVVVLFPKHGMHGTQGKAGKKGRPFQKASFVLVGDAAQEVNKAIGIEVVKRNIEY